MNTTFIPPIWPDNSLSDLTHLSEASGRMASVGEQRLAPLHLASRHETLTQFFLQRGADVNTADRIFGETALHWAVRANRARVVRLLLEYGANLAARTKKGETPLAIMPYQPKSNLVTESGAESAQSQLADLLRRAAAPQFSSVEVDDKRAKLTIIQTHIGAFYQAIHHTIPVDISYSMVSRMDLYANNYVYRYDAGGRLLLPHILFRSQQDAMLFMDLITSLRDAQ